MNVSTGQAYKRAYLDYGNLTNTSWPHNYYITGNMAETLSRYKNQETERVRIQDIDTRRVYYELFILLRAVGGKVEY